MKIVEHHTTSMLIWLRMIRFVEHSNQLSNEFLKQFGLTVNQFEVLVQVRALQPTTQKNLAEKLTVSRGGISRMLTRLEKEGLIIRKQDWKKKYISLTNLGEQKLMVAYQDQISFQSSLFDDILNNVEKNQLNMIMKKLYNHSLEKKIPIIKTKNDNLNC